MDEALGFISVIRTTWIRTFFESLYLTDDKVIVLRVDQAGFMGHGVGDVILGWYGARDEDKYLAKLSPEEALSSNENNYVIPFSEITRVELKKWGRGGIITIKTTQKKYRWGLRGLPEVKKSKFGDYEEILRNVFSEKFFVKK
jgi:hypothetical protein